MNIHTDNSPDGTHSPMFICETAIAKGLRAITFTDHCEIDEYYEHKYDYSTKFSYFECSKARAAFRGQLLVLIGIEIGDPLSNPELAQEVLQRNELDYVLACVHELKQYRGENGKIDFYEIDVYKYFNEYLEKLIEIAKWNSCDAIAHLTYPLREIIGECGLDFKYEKIKEPMDTLLRTMAQNSKALEINTAGLRMSIEKILPEKTIIQRFHELGGKYITIGSDSHRAYTVGYGIKNAMILAKEAGFDKLTFYEKREPLQVGINL